MIIFLYVAAVLLVLGSMGMTLGPLLSGNASRKRVLKRLDRVSGRDTLPAPGSVNVTVRRDIADSSIKVLDRLIKHAIPRPVMLVMRRTPSRMRLTWTIMSSAEEI